MGLWTWAEITTGIIISCLPTTPKFFLHAGPKVRRMFPASIRLRFRVHQQSEFASVKNKPEVSVPMERWPVGHEVGRDNLRTWGRAANGPTGSQGHGIPLTKIETAILEAATKDGRQPVLIEEIVVRLGDLESGK